MNLFSIGNVVRHESSEELGTVTDVRDDEYGVYVKWDSQPDRNDWYMPQALVMVRGAAHSPLQLEDIGNGYTKHKPEL